MIKSILFVVFAALIILFLVGIIVSTNTKKGKIIDVTNGNKKKLNKISIIGLLVSLIGTILIPGSFHQVEAGQVAVVKSLGKVVGTRLPGTYFDFCLTTNYTYFDTTVQKLEINTSSYSSDAQTMNIQMTVQFKIDPGKAENILTEYTNMDSLGQRIEKAVEDKVVAEQQKEAAITKAEQELEVAKLTAQAKIEAARGDAESQKIIASASAEAMALKIVELSKSLGFKVNETYVQSVETVKENTQTNEIVSKETVESETNTYPNIGVMVSYEEDGLIKTTISTSLASTKYSIVYDETHTKDDLNIVVEFVKYLEYLEKWDGKLPSVMTGQDNVDIIIPSNPSAGE